MAACVAAGLAACSGGGTSTPTPSALPLRTAAPQTYLLTLDELPLAEFQVQDAPAAVDATTLAGGDQVRLDRLTHDQLQAAARVRFFRPVTDLGNSNGPVDVVATVERFAASDGAADAFTAEAQHQDSAPGATPLSTGPLGDEGHGDLVTADSAGVTVAQTTLVWRTVNLVSILVVRERLGGSPLAHALTVARPMLVRQGGATPLPQ